MAISERLSQAVEKAWRIEQLEEVNHAYTQMLAFVSHELKSPVASMVTDAELMSQGYLGDLTEVQLTKLDGMARKGRYLLGLVNEYLDLARVESGELTLDPTSRVNVNDQVIGEALELVAPQLEARRVQLVTELPHAPLPLICCDPTLLRIVLVNLLDNAVKYGNEDGTIRLRAEVTSGREDNPARLKISVGNLGPGFSAEEKNKLFRRFSRLDDPALKTRRGTGVGLYNAWRIIQLHKGRITADSKHGEWALHAAATKDAGRVREILAKARELNGLAMDEVAVLSSVSDPKLLGELFGAARDAKDAIYGARLVLFAPLYVSNLCTNDCLYCAFRVKNEELKRRALTQDEIRREVEILVDQGHKRVLLVAGESYPKQGFQYVLDSIATIYDVKRGNGEIRRVNVNVAPRSVDEFRALKGTGIGTYQLFQ